MTNGTFFKSLIAAMFFTIMFAVSSQTATSQVKCGCDYITVYGTDDLPCKVEFCVKTAGNLYCDYIAPGVKTQFKCDTEAGLYIKDICGNYVEVTEGDCVKNIFIEEGCCIYACVWRENDGCLVVEVGFYSKECQCR